MISATFEEAPQKDGRKYVTFKFVADDGSEHSEIGLFLNEYNPAKDLDAHVVRWDEMLAQGEAVQNASLTLQGRDAEVKFALSTPEAMKAQIILHEADAIAAKTEAEAKLAIIDGAK